MPESVANRNVSTVWDRKAKVVSPVTRVFLIVPALVIVELEGKGSDGLLILEPGIFIGPAVAL